MKPNHRACIYPKDIQNITGKSYKQSRLFLHKIRIHFSKRPDQLVSLEEFCEYTGLQLEHVSRFIK